MSHSLSRQGADEGAEEGPNEGVGEEGHVLVRAGGVQLQTGKCRDQIGEEIHLWNIWSLHINFIQSLLIK